MAKVPAFAKAFAGRWRIVEMDVWDNDFLDLVEEAHLTFTGAADGEIAFGALKASSIPARLAGWREPVPSSPARGRMKTIRPSDAAGSQSAPQAAWSATSTSTTATTQASSANQMTSSTAC